MKLHGSSVQQICAFSLYIVEMGHWTLLTTAGMNVSVGDVRRTSSQTRTAAATTLGSAVIA